MLFHKRKRDVEADAVVQHFTELARMLPDQVAASGGEMDLLPEEVDQVTLDIFTMQAEHTRHVLKRVYGRDTTIPIPQEIADVAARQNVTAEQLQAAICRNENKE